MYTNATMCGPERPCRTDVGPSISDRVRQCEVATVDLCGRTSLFGDVDQEGVWIPCRPVKPGEFSVSAEM